MPDNTETATSMTLPTDAEENELLETTQEQRLSGFVPPQGVTWKTTWRNAPSYRDPQKSQKPLGILREGKNYFYSQRDLGVRVTVRDAVNTYTNTWWALTDDDSGNTKVWVSCVYIVGGDNDEPVPGLPTK